MYKDDHKDINILIDTLKANIKVLDMLNNSNKNDKEHYLLLITQELHKLCEKAIPLLDSKNKNTA